MALNRRLHKLQQQHNTEHYDDQGFYNAQPEPDNNAVDEAYYDADATGNQTDESWNLNEDEYYPKPTTTTTFVRPRPKQKTSTSSTIATGGATPFQPLSTVTTENATSAVTTTSINHPKSSANGSFRPRPPSQGNSTSAQALNDGFQSLAAAGFSMATSKMLGGDVGSNMDVVQGLVKDRLLQNINPSVLSLAYYKYYFCVDNEYVLRKMTRLLLPFLSLAVQDWKRKKNDASMMNGDHTTSFVGSYSYEPPTKDLNAPDGYLPLMAIITYVVIMGFVVGTHSSDSFSPQILIATASSALVMLIVEVLLMKIGFYLIGSVATPPYWLDIVCYTGYKLVFVTINLIINLILPSLVLYYAISIATGTIAAVFMIQTLRPYFRDLMEFNSENEPKKTRKIFLGIVGVAQILFIQLMGRYTSV
eukprot:CAMPEP_0202726736 /NCGR_PEP_ID=MMETSP1385-20130828/184763_1 /ASSEMBLY_ACC=CAM_ASM_000861 /TAXON_ID=933848 /ORGANISM="Elphidium margaritaceum" /LENGTH=418 /DNA_ID=CAMNT_0049392963 /DNA_START=10 /DNA_END=1266 /DNA_ORIENTATION=-